MAVSPNQTFLGCFANLRVNGVFLVKGRTFGLGALLTPTVVRKTSEEAFMPFLGPEGCGGTDANTAFQCLRSQNSKSRAWDAVRTPKTQHLFRKGYRP